MTATYYTREHEWVTIRDGIASVGITEYAAGELGEITFLELPPVGKEVRQFQALCAVESAKAASDIYAPLSGKVVAINEVLNDTPEIVNESPEESGWMVSMEITDPDEVKNLLSREDYLKFVKSL